jgi:hypothetical protein
MCWYRPLKISTLSLTEKQTTVFEKLTADIKEIDLLFPVLSNPPFPGERMINCFLAPVINQHRDALRDTTVRTA